jgi:hypothetical protein
MLVGKRSGRLFPAQRLYASQIFLGTSLAFPCERQHRTTQAFSVDRENSRAQQTPSLPLCRSSADVEARARDTNKTRRRIHL